MNKKCYIQLTRLLLAVAVGFVLSVHLAAATPSLEGVGEERALDIVRRASTYLTQAEQFRFTSDTVYVINPASDEPIEFRASQDISIKRPNRASGIVNRQDEGTRRVWYDGKTLTVLEEPDQVYTTLAVPETIDATLDYLIDQDFAVLPLVNILYSDLSFMETRAESWRYAGEEMVGEVRCHRLAFVGPEAQGELWVEVGDKPLFRKAVVNYPQQEGQPQFSAHIDHWQVGLDLPEAQFAFTAPEEAKQMPLAAMALQQAQDASVNPDIDAQALRVLRQASAFLSKVERFQVTADTSYEVVQESGQKLQFSAVRDFTLQRPDRVFVTTLRDDKTTRRVWYDGKTVTFLEEPENVYGKVDVPDTIDATLDYLEQEVMTPVPLADLAYSDLSFLETRAESGIYVGKSLVRGLACHHLAFRNEGVDWQLWIEDGEQPLFRKVVITYKQQDGQPQFVAWLHEWKPGAEQPDTVFIFEPPQGAEQIQILAFDSPFRNQTETAQ